MAENNTEDLLGFIGKDRVTGLEGLVIARADFIDGKQWYYLKPLEPGDVINIDDDIESIPLERIQFVRKTHINTQITRPKTELGCLVKDKLTGYIGKVIGVRTYIYGRAPDIFVIPRNEDYERLSTIFAFNEPRLIVLPK